MLDEPIGNFRDGNINHVHCSSSQPILQSPVFCILSTIQIGLHTRPALAIATSTATTMDLAKGQSSLLAIPPELRLIIYDMLLTDPNYDSDAVDTTSIAARWRSVAPEYHDYEAPSKDVSTAIKTSRPIIRIRTEDPAAYELRQPCHHKRARFVIRSDRFRARCMWTTYHLLSGPDLTTQVLLANARIHAEAAKLLYSSYTFDFDTHVEAIVPFLAG